jgi:c-di-GMP-related signal transduction protein
MTRPLYIPPASARYIPPIFALAELPAPAPGKFSARLPIDRYVNNLLAGQGAKAAQVKGIPPLRYVARQPIFDRNEKVFGYELLFRDGLENAFSGTDTDEASRATLDRTLLMGLDVLCDGRRAFVNCTKDTLIKGLVTLLPAATTVVEVLESVTPDPDVIRALTTLKQEGYMIALDDYVADDPREKLTELAHIIKVEMPLTTEKQREELIRRSAGWDCLMLAEKIETQSDFFRTRDQGFHYFQGYFFRRPEVLNTRDMPANRMNYLRMMQEVSRPDLDVPGLERLIKSEASVCYRLLRYLNSSVFGLKSEIHSVKHALSMLGERELRRWVRLVAAVGAGQDKPSDLLLSALVRGRFGELLGPRVPHGESDLFLMGLLSLIDAMLDMPIEDVLEKIPLDHETKAVLLGKPSVLRPVYQLMLAHESGEWEEAARLSAEMHLESEIAAGCYWQAQQWARGVVAGA